MLGIFDSHAHYDDSRFDEDREELLTKMAEAGVTYIVNVSADMESVIGNREIVKKYPFIYGSAGVHPEDADKLTDADMDIIREAAGDEKIVAIGEIGLDYHYPEPERSIQKEWFIKQLDIAAELQMPVIIHSREAAEDTMNILSSYNGRLFKGNAGVVHCYSYSVEMALKYIDMGYNIGVGGVLTFSNAKKLKEVVKNIPLEKIVIETDCPYLAPTPHRGERNDSRLLIYVADAIAEIKGVSRQEVISVTCENALKMYRIEV